MYIYFVVLAILSVCIIFGFKYRITIQSEREGKAYNGRIAPKNIGRRKDFWYRLNMAYGDLLMQNVLRRFKGQYRFTFEDIVDEFFTDWEERFDDLMSSDPCEFPPKSRIKPKPNKEAEPP